MGKSCLSENLQTSNISEMKRLLYCVLWSVREQIAVDFSTSLPAR